MKKSAILSLIVALLFPVAGYLFVKYLSKDAVHMPKRYFYDGVATNTIKGKTTTDTLWHQVKGIPFTNQLGKKVQLSDLHGKIIVMNFFFSRCPVVCPGLTRNMKRLQNSFAKSDSIVQFISVSVDPEYDSAAIMRKYADRFDINYDNWWFVTGEKKAIYDFAIKEMKANIADTNVDTAFIHTENFFLLDSNRVIRGFYNGFDTLALAKLASNIPTLLLEKNKKSPSIFREFIPILPIIFMGIGVVFIVMLIINKKRTS